MSITEEKLSEKLEQAGGQPKNRGAYSADDATPKGLALVEVKHRDTKLYWLVDPLEDRICNARFFSYGGKVSVAIGETLSHMVRGLTVAEACSLRGEDVERALRDEEAVPAVPESRLGAFAVVEDLLRTALQEYASAKAVALAGKTLQEKQEGASAFKEMSLAEQVWLGMTEEEQVEQLDLVIEEKIRPALRRDGGDAYVKRVIEGRKVIIQYAGNCGSCGSSVGGTLAFIEQTLRKNVYGDLTVVPSTYADMI